MKQTSLSENHIYPRCSKTYEVTCLSVLHLDLMENNFLKGTYATDMHSESRMQNCLFGLNAKLSCNNLRHPKTADGLSSCNESTVCTISAQWMLWLNREALIHFMYIPVIPLKPRELCWKFFITSGNKPRNFSLFLSAPLKTSNFKTSSPWLLTGWGSRTHAEKTPELNMSSVQLRGRCLTYSWRWEERWGRGILEQCKQC